MPSDWDEDSPELDANIASVVERVRSDSLARKPLSLALIKSWHVDLMKGLVVDDPAYVGRFRGESGVAGYEVGIGSHEGVPSHKVAAEVLEFEAWLQSEVDTLDKKYPTPASLTAAGIQEVVDLAAKAHSTWVFIHPFANGNGRTARLLANSIFLRHGLGLPVTPRPRPLGPYELASSAAMLGNWRPTAQVFMQMLLAAMLESESAQVPPPPSKKKR